MSGIAAVNGNIDAPFVLVRLRKPVERARRERIAGPGAVLGGDQRNPAAIDLGEARDVFSCSRSVEDPDEEGRCFLPPISRQRGKGDRQFVSSEAGTAVGKKRPGYVDRPR